MDGGVLTDGERLESATSWRLVGRHDNRLLSGVRRSAVRCACPPASKYSRTSLPNAARTVDPARLCTHQYLLDGHTVAGHVDSLCRLDDSR